MSSLEHLDLSHCRISGRGFFALSRLTEFRELDCTYCPIRDSHLPQLRNCPRLNYLNLTNCSHLTAAGIQRCLELMPHTRLNISGLSAVADMLRRKGFTVEDGVVSTAG